MTTDRHRDLAQRVLDSKLHAMRGRSSANTLHEVQRQNAAWAAHNFPGQATWMPLLGAVEELGELAHAHLKQAQRIRTDEDHDAKARDAIGDVMIYLCHYCTLRGWDIDKILRETWASVAARDWQVDRVKGGGHE